MTNFRVYINRLIGIRKYKNIYCLFEYVSTYGHITYCTFVNFDFSYIYICITFGLCLMLKYPLLTIGIIAKSKFHDSLSNVDFLHGLAESFLTLTNLFIVLGIRDAIK